MFDQLVNLVKQFSGDTVVNNPEVPNQHNNEVIAEATHSISGGLQNAIAGGGLQNVLGLLTGKTSSGSGLMSNPIVQSIIGSFAGKLLGKYGVNPSAAGNIASSLIPNVLNGLISKTNDAKDSSFNLQGILGSLTGQQNAGGLNIAGLLGGLGKDADGDGDTDFKDIIASFTGGALQQRAQQQQQGGLMNIITNFLK
jgi:hypothetical protein